MKYTGIGAVIPLEIYTSAEKSPYPQAVRHMGEIVHPLWGKFDVAFTNEQRPRIVITHSVTGRHSYLKVDGLIEDAAKAMMVRDA